MLIIDSKFRYFVQDLRDLPNRVLCALPRPFHVLRQLIQHFHENFLHRCDCIHNLPNANPQTFLHYIRLPRRLVPTFKSTAASSYSARFYCARRGLILGIRLVFFPLAGGTCVRPLNYHAQQNQDSRKHD